VRIPLLDEINPDISDACHSGAAKKLTYISWTWEKDCAIRKSTLTKNCKFTCVYCLKYRVLTMQCFCVGSETIWGLERNSCCE
jgi:hypothetical protein